MTFCHELAAMTRRIAEIRPLLKHPDSKTRETSSVQKEETLGMKNTNQQHNEERLMIDMGKPSMCTLYGLGSIQVDSRLPCTSVSFCFPKAKSLSVKVTEAIMNLQNDSPPSSVDVVKKDLKALADASDSINSVKSRLGVVQHPDHNPEDIQECIETALKATVAWGVYQVITRPSITDVVAGAAERKKLRKVAEEYNLIETNKDMGRFLSAEDTVLQPKI